MNLALAGWHHYRKSTLWARPIRIDAATRAKPHWLTVMSGQPWRMALFCVMVTWCMGAGRAKIENGPGARGGVLARFGSRPLPHSISQKKKKKIVAGQSTIKSPRSSTGAMVCPTMVQVTNVSPLATTQQMKELFSYLGDIVDIKLYPGDQAYVTGSYKLPTP